MTYKTCTIEEQEGVSTLKANFILYATAPLWIPTIFIMALFYYVVDF